MRGWFTGVWTGDICIHCINMSRRYVMERQGGASKVDRVCSNFKIMNSSNE